MWVSLRGPVFQIRSQRRAIQTKYLSTSQILNDKSCLLFVVVELRLARVCKKLELIIVIQKRARIDKDTEKDFSLFVLFFAVNLSFSLTHSSELGLNDHLDFTEGNQKYYEVKKRC